MGHRSIAWVVVGRGKLSEKKGELSVCAMLTFISGSITGCDASLLALSILALHLLEHEVEKQSFILVSFYTLLLSVSLEAQQHLLFLSCRAYSLEKIFKHTTSLPSQEQSRNYAVRSIDNQNGSGTIAQGRGNVHSAGSRIMSYSNTYYTQVMTLKGVLHDESSYIRVSTWCKEQNKVSRCCSHPHLKRRSG